MYLNLALLAAFAFLYSAASGRLERSPINGAVVFTGFGLLFGPLGFGLLDLEVDAEGLRVIAELTLALVLFSDAANANLGVLRKSIHIPERLLGLGLPLTILLGFAIGVAMFGGLTLLEIAIMATILAPTDAALGKAVVTSEAVPENMREGLNIESGLNDGICVPILFVLLSLAVGMETEGGTMQLALTLVAEEIGIGLAVGLALTLCAAGLLRFAVARDWLAGTWKQVPVVVLAVACFSVAQVLGGSGFIAAFSGGLLFGALVKQHKHEMLESAESTGDVMALVTWVVFGAAVIGPALGYFSWEVVGYALLSLTIIRMLPVFLVLLGSGLRADQKLFMGWFGPRGLASVVFAVIVLNEHLPGGETIVMAVICAVALSILGHGLSANPLVKALSVRLRRSLH